MNDDKLYKFRKEIKKLYKNDVYNTGDLCSKILELRDKYRSVESIKIALDFNQIDVNFVDGTSPTKVMEVKEKIANCIGRYIVGNRNLLDPEINNDDAFDDFLNSGMHWYCDIFVVGTSVRFAL